MICARCYGEVIWIGDLLNPEGTQCQDCHSWNCQITDLDDDDSEEGEGEK